MMMTKRDSFINKEDLMQILMMLPPDCDFEIPVPAIIKPQKLWSGKQIISLIIPNHINFIRHFESPKANPVTGKMERNKCPAKDSMVLVSNGELLCGTFNKPIVGSSAGGLIHILFKECGP